MDNWDIRVQATAIIWAAFAVAAGLTGLAAASSDNAVLIVLITSLAAVVSTAIVWLFVSLYDDERGTIHRAAAKAKRDTREDARLALLLRLMNDEQRRAVQQQLAADLGADGELVSLADLVADDSQARTRTQG